MKNYIVVGGGLAGLTAAVEIASHGHAVELYEQSKSLGGRAATPHQEGYAANWGPHAVYQAGALKAQLEAWGIPHSGKAPFGRGDPYLIAKGARFPKIPS